MVSLIGRLQKKQASKNGRREDYKDFGCNPCSEIILRNKQFCNLTEVVVRANDTADTLKKKVELLLYLVRFQATLTNFRYLTSKWKQNTEGRIVAWSIAYRYNGQR